MNKKIKQVMLSSLAIVLLVCPLFTVNAAEQRETSTLNMQGGTQLTGAYRKYNYKNHKISIKPTLLEFAYYNTFNRIDITLQKKGLFGGSDKSKVSAHLAKVGETYTYEMGNHGSGSFRYFFYTNTNMEPWNGRTLADPVYMYSYE